MIFGIFPDLGVWTGAMEQLVYTCGVLVIGAGVVRGASLVLLNGVRCWTRIRVLGRSHQTQEK